MRNILCPIFALLVVIAGQPAVSAHHSFAAEFDDTKPLKITGTLMKVEWANPHIWYYVEVKNSDGTTTTWGLSGGAPGVAGLSAQNAAVPRTPDGKPDFTGIYQWPTYLPGQERGRSNATTFDRKNFAPLKPGGEAFLEPRTGVPRHDEPRDFCMPAGFPAASCPATPCSSSRRRATWSWCTSSSA